MTDDDSPGDRDGGNDGDGEPDHVADGDPHNKGDGSDAGTPRLGLVVARFYPELADEIAAHAVSRAADRGAAVVEHVGVPGVYDAPVVADRLAARADVDAVAVLGVIVAGDTDHDQVVAHASARLLGRVALDRGTPVAFGVVGPDASAAEAHERVENAAGAVDAALDTHDALAAVDS